MNLLIEYVTRYYAGKEFREPEWHGYLYAGTMLICISGVSLLNAQAYAQVCEAHPFHKVHSIPKNAQFQSYILACNIRTGITSTVFRKALRLSRWAKTSIAKRKYCAKIIAIPSIFLSAARASEAAPWARSST